MLNVINYEDKKMGIHYTYKSQRGERSLKKQEKQMERQRRSRNRKLLKKQQDIKSNSYVVPPEQILTLDLLTDPSKRK